MLQNKWKNRLAAILVCGLAVTAPLVAYAEDEDLQQQIDSYQQQIQEQQGVKADAEKRTWNRLNKNSRRPKTSWPLFKVSGRL